MNGVTEQWHLSKAIPVSIIIFLAAQTIGLIVWAVKLDYRVAGLESANIVRDVKIKELETTREKLILIEERQNNVIKVLDANGKKLDLLVDEITRKRVNNQQ